MKALATLALVAVAGIAVAAAPAGGRAPAAASCGTPVIGMSAPISGAAGAIGRDQLHWAEYYMARWNEQHPTFKVALRYFDDKIDPTKAVTGAHTFASNPSVLAVIGPTGSQQVFATAPVYKKAGLAMVSGSATTVTLTRGGRLKGTFFRVVPNDDVQGPSDVEYAMTKLGVKASDHVMLVNQRNAYGKGLRAAMKRAFEAKGVKVATASIAKTDTDFTSIVDRTVNDKVVFLLTQVATQSQRFASQMKARGRTAPVFATDGSFDASKFHVDGSYVSFFAPDVTTMPSAKALLRGFYAKYGRGTTPFGPPNYVAAELEVAAIQKACADGKVSRGEVRKWIAKTNLTTTLLGRPLRFTANGDVRSARFSVFKIVNGKYTVVG
ncbi:MAG: branched-chain amino acid transport system substrate-binding protein [Gaiellaceae bacterium]|nr:branched-chain amino acid transport system substrate-binding protein [Gaiellaceae bacterium]